MTRRLVLSYLTIALFVLIVLEVPLGVSFARNQRDRLTVDIERDAVVIGSLVEDALQSGAEAADPALGDYTERAGSRVVITDRAGVSVHDSAAPVRALPSTTAEHEPSTSELVTPATMPVRPCPLAQWMSSRPPCGIAWMVASNSHGQASPASMASMSEKSDTTHGNSDPSGQPEPRRKKGVAERS